MPSATSTASGPRSRCTAAPTGAPSARPSSSTPTARSPRSSRRSRPRPTTRSCSRRSASSRPHSAAAAAANPREVTGWAEDLLLGGGYVLLAVLILLENLFPPIPSELLLPLAGSRVAGGDFDFVAGALILYSIGRFGGRPLLLRHGRILRLDERRLDRADGWFDAHGPKLVLLGRLIPGVRSVVSVP